MRSLGERVLAQPELPADAPPEVARMHELGLHIQNQVEFIRDLMADQQEATGDDSETLHRITTEVKIELLAPRVEADRIAAYLSRL